MKIKKKFQDSVIGWLEKKYPGVRDIVDLLDNVRERVDKQYIKGLTELEDLTEHDKEEMKDIKCLRPYHVESTSSRPITEVKQH